MYEKAVGLGLGYLVYKRLMSELAQEPDNGGVSVSEGMLGFKGLTSEEVAQAITGTESGLFQDIFNPRKAVGYTDPYQDWLRAGGVPKPAEKMEFEQWGETISTAYTFLPEGFELVGPSTTWTTRPKGLD